MTRVEIGELYVLRAKVDRQIQAELKRLENAARRERERFERMLKNDALCGTDSGYHKHLRQLKQPACGECKHAHAVAERERVTRQKDARLAVQAVRDLGVTVDALDKAAKRESERGDAA